MKPQEFVNKWANPTLRESQGAQHHFLDVCRLVGLEMPGDGKTAKGDSFVFEQSLAQAGGRGFADVWYENHFAIEYKSPGKYQDLGDAYKQLLRYREKLNNPPLLAVTDFERWELHTNFPNTQKRVYKFAHSQIAREPRVMAWLRAMFHAPERLHPRRNAEQVTKEAAEAFQLIAENMREWETAPQRIAFFLTKLVFCLFAEDIGLLPNAVNSPDGIFSHIIKQSRGKPNTFKQYVQNLFKAMNDGGDFLLRDIDWFNGSLFNVVTVEELSLEAIDALETAAELNWESIEPSIFGTLFERSLDPRKRSQLGSHYTSRDDILLIVEPVLMQPLRYAWDTVQLEAQPIRQRYDEARTGRARAHARAQLLDLREGILKRIRETTVLDPACGSGNFLYVSLQMLMDLEKEVIQHPLWAGLQLATREVHPRQMYGIEIDPIAHALASIVVWIGYIQWRINNGYGQEFSEPILEELEGNIVCKDAILPPADSNLPLSPQSLGGADSNPPQSPQGLGGAASNPPQPPQSVGGKAANASEIAGAGLPLSEASGRGPGGGVGNVEWRAASNPPQSPQGLGGKAANTSENAGAGLPLSEASGRGPGGGVESVEWPAVDVIVGNPPFLGGQRMRGELGDDYYERLTRYYSGCVRGGADLVCYWYERARKHIEDGKADRAGLLATNSIRGGVNREVLKRIKASGDIFMAWSNRPWILDGAAVRVSLIGFDDGRSSQATLDGKAVESINADLTSSIDVSQAEILPDNKRISFQGPVKVGRFDITESVAIEMLSDRNISGVDNAKVIKPFRNGNDLVGELRNYWIIDFDNMEIEHAAEYEAPFNYVETHIKPVRAKNKNRKRRENWWKLGASGRSYRDAARQVERQIFTSRVSKHRIFVWVDKVVFPGDATVAIAREDDYFFGVLHSRLHEVWSLRMGTWLGKGNDPRYTPTTTFETFPFPWPPGHEDLAHPAHRRISAAARQLHAERHAWQHPDGISPKQLKDRTLTNLYNALAVYRGRSAIKVKPEAGDFAPRLDALHRELDEAVCDAYGWGYGVLEDEEEILRRLLELNLGRAD